MNLIIARLLMKVFVKNFDDDSMPPVGRPWSWATTSAGKASEAGVSLRDLGVRKLSCKVLVAGDEERVLAELVWNLFQGASEWGNGGEVLGNSRLVGSLPSMATAARLADATGPRRSCRCLIL